MEEMKIPISDGNVVEYYIADTGEKKKLVRDRVRLPEEEEDYDIEYYLEHQILPAVENILHVFDIEIKEIINKKNQNQLSKWM